MKHLIDKDALVAEIERRINKEIQRCAVDLGYSQGLVNSMRNILSFIDTLEMKEVHWEKEFDYYTKDIMAYDILSTPFTHLYNCAKHFFEIGLSVNNPITAADRGTAEEVIINLKRVEKDYRIDLTKEIEWLRNKVKKGE